ncbi:hypothetical protein E4L95_21655 [Paracoccus liaowanqingii]|uniref:Polysaccharide export protein N-terminal domain-containing protein n=1 Tax=Paracoccus liaowanqingii TaxID=2560053 RepID=A0A4Z1C5X3_9RHOB|nr:polysaccharide biosynthesis/export family protein [Paracoccus liaowanqingii]TGN40750.1 hypothetical protein E4L95_21655 [Paracoccus liaowanqingii]
MIYFRFISSGDTKNLQTVKQPPDAKFRLLTFCSSVIISAIFAASADAKGYALQGGDTLALSVVGAPELQSIMTIDIDGNITAPLVGSIPVVGQTLEQVTIALRDALSEVSYTAISGAELMTLQILPSSVMLSLESYRPIYVDGDILSPGAFDFAPGLTARRAVALAGGYGMARLLAGDPAPQLLTLQGDRQRLEIERAAIEVRAERMRAELVEDEINEISTIGSPRDMAPAEFAGTEKLRLSTGLKLEKEAAEHYDVAVAMTRQQISTLQERLRTEAEGVTADTTDFDRLLEGQNRGAVSTARLADARRTLLFSTTRELQTKSELDRAEMELEVLGHARDQGKIERRAIRLGELSEAILSLEAVKAELSSVERRIVYLRSAVLDPDTASDVEVLITRSDGRRKPLRPNEDAMLAPGDLVSVRLKLPVFDN